MKIAKAKLRQIIKEELNEVSMNYREAEAYEALANAVGDLIRDALEGSGLGGLSPDAIRDAIGEALAEELGAEEPEEEEEEEEEALVLRGPKFDPLGDSPAALRQRAMVRGPGDN